MWHFGCLEKGFHSNFFFPHPRLSFQKRRAYVLEYCFDSKAWRIVCKTNVRLFLFIKNGNCELPFLLYFRISGCFLWKLLYTLRVCKANVRLFLFIKNGNCELPFLLYFRISGGFLYKLLYTLSSFIRIYTDPRKTIFFVVPCILSNFLRIF
jgi:hypothetical protein